MDASFLNCYDLGDPLPCRKCPLWKNQGMAAGEQREGVSGLQHIADPNRGVSVCSVTATFR